MRSDKEKAENMRKDGKSYREIEKELSIPRSTLSEWLSPHGWSRNIRDALTQKAQKENTTRLRRLNRIRGARLKRLYLQAQREAEEEFVQLKYHPLFIAGLMLYWGEGDRVSKGPVRLANIDPVMIRLFLSFLLHICQIPKRRIRLMLFTYDDLNDDECRRYWIDQTGFDRTHFTKEVHLPSRHKTKRVRSGVCSVVVSSTYFKKKMLTWLKLGSKELLNPEYYMYRRD